jgi:hypothetical protein
LECQNKALHFRIRCLEFLIQMRIAWTVFIHSS